MVQGQPFIPAAKPALDSGQSAPFILAGYGLGGAVQIAGEVLSLAGEPVEGASVSIGERKAADDPTLAQWAGEVQLEAVQGGEYVLRVTATDPESGESLSSSITVSVAG